VITSYITYQSWEKKRVGRGEPTVQGTTNPISNVKGNGKYENWGSVLHTGYSALGRQGEEQSKDLNASKDKIEGMIGIEKGKGLIESGLTR